MSSNIFNNTLLEEIRRLNGELRNYVIPHENTEAAMNDFRYFWDEIIQKINEQEDGWRAYCIEDTTALSETMSQIMAQYRKVILQQENDLLCDSIKNDESLEQGTIQSESSEFDIKQTNKRAMIKLSIDAPEFVPSSKSEQFSESIEVDNTIEIDTSEPTQDSTEMLVSPELVKNKNEQQIENTPLTQPDPMETNKSSDETHKNEHTSIVQSTVKINETKKEVKNHCANCLESIPTNYSRASFLSIRDIMKSLEALPKVPDRYTPKDVRQLRSAVQDILHKVKLANLPSNSLEPIILLKTIGAFGGALLSTWNYELRGQPFTFAQVREFLANIEEVSLFDVSLFDDVTAPPAPIRPHPLAHTGAIPKTKTPRSATQSTNTVCVNQSAQSTSEVASKQPNAEQSSSSTLNRGPLQVTRRANTDEFETSVLGARNRPKKIKIDPTIIVGLVSMCVLCNRPHYFSTAIHLWLGRMSSS